MAVNSPFSISNNTSNTKLNMNDNIDSSLELFDVKLNQCLHQLLEKQQTHPQLSYLWYEYLINNSLNETDIVNCFKAIENMNTMPDISICQIMMFKEIIIFLCDKKNRS